MQGVASRANHGRDEGHLYYTTHIQHVHLSGLAITRDSASQAVGYSHVGRRLSDSTLIPASDRN